MGLSLATKAEPRGQGYIPEKVATRNSPGANGFSAGLQRLTSPRIDTDGALRRGDRGGCEEDRGAGREAGLEAAARVGDGAGEERAERLADAEDHGVGGDGRSPRLRRER